MPEIASSKLLTHSFTPETQFLCISNPSLKGQETKKTKKQAQQLPCSSHLKDRTEDMREHMTKAQEKKLSDNIHLLSPTHTLT